MFAEGGGLNHFQRHIWQCGELMDVLRDDVEADLQAQKKRMLGYGRRWSAKARILCMIVYNLVQTT